MDCRTIRTLAAGKRTQDLPPAAQSHLDACAACRDELEDLPSALIAPSSADPPPDLASHILARLPAAPPALAERQERNRRLRRRAVFGLLIVLMVLILQIGLLGVFVDSNLPASMVGGVEHSAGRLLLALTIAAKPIAGILAQISLLLFVAAAFGVVLAGRLWLRLMEPPAPLLVEVTT